MSEVEELNSVDEVIRALVDMLQDPHRANCIFKHIIHSMMHLDSFRLLLDHVFTDLLCHKIHIRVEIREVDKDHHEMTFFLFYSPALGLRMSGGNSLLSAQEHVCVRKLIEATLQHRPDALMTVREDNRGDHNRIMFITHRDFDRVVVDRSLMVSAFLTAMWEVVLTAQTEQYHASLGRLLATEIELSLAQLKETDFTLTREEGIANIKAATRIAQDLAVSRRILTPATMWHD